MTLHNEQVFARKLMNTVIEVLQGHGGFSEWLANLSANDQLHLSISMIRFLKRDIREIETHILGKEFFKDGGENGKDVS